MTADPQPAGGPGPTIDPEPAAGPGAGSLEVALAHVLQVGTYLSIALVAVGCVLLLASGHSPTEGGPPLSLEDLPGDLLALRPAGLLWLGILGVLATPGLRVVRALLGFARRQETGMAATSAAVLVVIAIGVIVGVTAH